jgi:hypothetical protein
MILEVTSFYVLSKWPDEDVSLDSLMSILELPLPEHLFLDDGSFG